jgi:hypothetical protein
MKKSFALAAVALAASTAMATVTFFPTAPNPLSQTVAGAGFVGKGDVQIAFGWANAALQTNAAGVGFTYVENTEYTITCEKDIVNPAQTIVVVTHHTRTVGLNATVDNDPRKVNGQKQFTGFILKGFKDIVTESGDPIPVVNDACQGATFGNLTPVKIWPPVPLV